MHDDLTAHLISLERQRCAAISSGDIEALGRLLADELTHTHITGKTQDRETYLAGLSGRPRETARGDDLRVRVYGDTAVMTGTLRNSVPATEPGARPRVVEIHALQVWVRQPGGWHQVAFASSAQRPD
jgi:ketosteroid isomerase-like protein